MSLVVWLPLTKDLRNQGLNGIPVTFTGTINLNDGGKLGKCYKTSNTGVIDLKYSGAQINTGSISLCGWFKFNKSELAATWSGYSFDSTHPYPTGNLIGNNSYGGVGLIWYTNSLTSGASFTSLYAAGSIRSTANGARITNAVTIPFDTWVHLALIFNKTTKALELWMNGELKVTSTMLDFNDAKADNLKLNYSAVWGGNGPSYSIPFYVNDVRIYDNCLSSMEVKQLSQGLVLHYPLNRGGFGQENLIANTDFNGVSKKYTVTSSTEGGFRYTPTETIVANTEYTVSCRLRGDANMNLYKLCTGGNEAVYFVNRDQLSTSEYRRFSITFTYPSNKTLDQIYICTRYGTANSQAGDWFEIEPCSLKLEKGSIATPWCPNSSDELATTMGLNSTIEYDCSGYCNNGIRTGTFDWMSDTPKYQVSTKFNGTDNAIQTPSLPTMITDKNYTIAVWIYKTVIGSKGYQTIYGGPSGFEIEARNGSANETKFVPWNWGKPMASYELNEWNHCVFVHSDADCKIYLNGEYIATGTTKASNPTGNYFVGAWNTSTQQNFDGLMSDFRIYATALSADDVKSLYQNCATIDPDGTIRGQIRS